MYDANSFAESKNSIQSDPGVGGSNPLEAIITMSLQKGISAFIIKENRILLLKREVNPFKGFWEVPSGKLEDGESFEEAVIRELKEETSLKTKVIKEIGVNLDSKNGFESHMFLVKQLSGELINREPSKHSEVKFFEFGFLPKNLGGTTLAGLEILNKSTSK